MSGNDRILTFDNQSSVNECNNEKLFIQGYTYKWPNMTVGSSFTIKCGFLYPVIWTRRCLPGGVWSPNAKETVYQCTQSVSWLHLKNVLIFGWLSVAVVIITIAAALLFWVRRINAGERFRLFFFLLVSLDLSLIVYILRRPLPLLLFRAGYDYNSMMIACVVTKVFQLYFYETQNYWLLNVGIFLYLSVVHPLNDHIRTNLPIHAIGWLTPCVTVTVYMLSIGLYSKGDTVLLCYPPTGFFYLMDIPCLLTFMANLYFVIRIIRVMRLQLINEPGRPSCPDIFSVSVKHIVKNYIWLFGVMGQWKVMAAIPAYELPHRAAFIYRNVLIFITGASCIAATIPTSYGSREVRGYVRRVIELRKVRHTMRSDKRRITSRSSDSGSRH